MIKTLKHGIKNPLDTLFNTFINDKINKNVLPYNGIYERIQGYRQAQKENPCTCINNTKRLHYNPILCGLKQYKYYTKYKQKAKQVHRKVEFTIEIHTDSYIRILN